MVDAYDCGVPQRRRRAFIVAVRSTTARAKMALDEWRRDMESLASEPAVPRVCVRDVAPQLGDFLWTNPRGPREARIAMPCIAHTYGLSAIAISRSCVCVWIGETRCTPSLGASAASDRTVSETEGGECMYVCMYVHQRLKGRL